MIKLLDLLKEIFIFEYDPQTEKALANKAKSTGISKTILKSVYAKGLGAWKTGHRPGAGQHQWAMARVNSFVTGKGGARKADAKLWKRAQKSKNKK
jgi:hypothetical protein